jgi:hypothetical protein
MKKILGLTSSAILILTLQVAVTAQASSTFEMTVDSVALGMTGVSPHVERLNGVDRVWRSDGPGGTAVSDCTDAGVCTTVSVPSRLGNDITIVNSPNGNKRAYFKDIDGSFQQVYSAPCTDAGCTTLGARTATSDLMRVPSTQRAWGVPDAVLLPDGRVRIYIVEMPTMGKCLEKIASYISTDGVSFTKEPGWRLEGGYVDTEVLRAKDGDWIMILADIACTSSNRQELYTSTSQDGLSWTTPVMLKAAGVHGLDPAGYEVSKDVFRIYFAQSTGPDFVIKRGTLNLKQASTPTPTPTATAKKTTISCAKGSQVRKVTGVNPKCPTGFTKQTTITCVKGTTTRKVTAVNPKCPSGFKKK